MKTLKLFAAILSLTLAACPGSAQAEDACARFPQGSFV